MNITQGKYAGCELIINEREAILMDEATKELDDLEQMYEGIIKELEKEIAGYRLLLAQINNKISKGGLDHDQTRKMITGVLKDV